MKNKGFTLIEILIGIIIIGVLAGIAIPAYQKTIENTQKKEATSNLRSIHAAEKIYRMDEGVFSASLEDLHINISSVHDTYFDYSIPRAQENDFLATAERTNESYHLTINAAGVIAEHKGPYRPGGVALGVEP